MATTFKTITNNDIATTRTLLHEAIPLTGSIVSGTYVTSDLVTEENIKNYSHGMFQSVYDYPYLSSSANHIFDITCGYAPASAASSSGKTHSQHTKKINIYNQMAQTLVGYDSTGTIQKFDKDGDISGGGVKIKQAFFLNFARLLTKDEIKKGSFRITLNNTQKLQGTASTTLMHDAATCIAVGDYGASTSYKINSPSGEYGVLYTSSATPGTEGAKSGVGLIFYQAGIAVLSSSVFTNDPAQTASYDGTWDETLPASWSEFGSPTDHMSSVLASLTGATIQHSCDGFRNRVVNISFNNTTELNSTIYFCRANHNEFNFSSNPTYLSDSKIRVKGNNPAAEPVSYITTVGLYSSDNELLAVAKLSEPLKKTPSNELALRVRLDY